MPTRKFIPVADLLIDTENPRLAAEPATTREAVRAIAELQEEKLLVLAQDIVEHGINLSDSPIVIPSSEQPDAYIVLEGNRRISALRALENPSIIEGVVEDKIVKRFRELSRQYQENPIEEINCVIYEEREKAAHWIQLRHTGENEGAGIVRWGAIERARFMERRGEQMYYLQALDFLEDTGYLNSEERSDVPVTSLGRLLSNPDIRSKLGLEMKDKVLYTQFDEDEVAKGLHYIIEDLISKRIRTGDIYYKDDRLEYVNSIPEEHLPDTSHPTGSLRTLDASPKNAGHKKEETTDDEKTSKTRRSKPSSKDRKRLIPSACILRIEQPRINEIYRELKRLPVHDYPNAVAVLFRVFLELSIDDYIKRNALGVHERSKLGLKMEKVGADLEDCGKITEQQAKAVRRAAQKDYFLAATISTFNQYVHNPHFTPKPSELNMAWDDLSPFVEAMWSDK